MVPASEGDGLCAVTGVGLFLFRLPSRLPLVKIEGNLNAWYVICFHPLSPPPPPKHHLVTEGFSVFPV